MSDTPPWTDRLSVLVAVAALLVSAGSFVYQAQQAKEQGVRDDAQEARAQRQEARLDRQDVQQIASRVYVGEAPKYAARAHPSQAGQNVYVVMNASGAQIDGVWVEGKDGSSIRIFSIPRCTMYGLPDGFSPTALHFVDAFGRWRREAAAGGALTADSQQMPKQDTADSPWYEDVEGCPG